MCQYTSDCLSRSSAIVFALFALAHLPANGVAAEVAAYTKISNSGRELPVQAKLGTGVNDWACTRDEVTGLIWEIKTRHGLRSWRQTYSWYDSNPSRHGGFAGSVSEGICQQPGRCDTEKFVQDVNAQGLCGYRDWRLPSREELISLIKTSRSRPSINTDFFPNTPPLFFWSGSARAGHAIDAWSVGFNRGGVVFGNKYGADRVRLVRAGKTIPEIVPLDATSFCPGIPLLSGCR